MRLPSALPLEELDKAGYWFRREGERGAEGLRSTGVPRGVCDPKGAESPVTVPVTVPVRVPDPNPSFQSHFVFTSARYRRLVAVHKLGKAGPSIVSYSATRFVR